MSEASKRVLDWREQQRANGNQSVTVWIPGRIKELAVRLAFERRTDLGVVVAEALEAYAQTQGATLSPVVDRRRVEALIDARIAEALASQHPAPTGPPAPASALPSVPAGLKRCGKRHPPYVPKGRRGCPTCATERKRQQRQREKEQRLGARPT